MAKKKDIKKKINLDKEYYNAVKRCLKKWVLSYAKELEEKNGIDMVAFILEQCKEEYSRCIGDYYTEFFDKEDFVEFINYSHELVMAGENRGMVLDYIAKKISSKYNEKNLGWTPAMATFVTLKGYVCGMISLGLSNTEPIMLMGRFLCALISYCTLQYEKLINKDIKSVKRVDNGHFLEFKSSPLYTINEMKNNDIIGLLLINKITECGIDLVTGLLFEGIERSEYDLVWLGNEFENISITNETCEGYIPFDDILKIPEDKIYAFPKAGIHFEFLSKDEGIDYIEIQEKYNNYICRLVFTKGNSIKAGVASKICGSTSMSIIRDVFINNTDECVERLTSVGDKEFELAVQIPCDAVKYLKNYLDLPKDVSYCGVGYLSTKSDCQYKKMMHCILSCIYAAYYSPNRFSKRILLTTISSNGVGYSKDSAYRMAHLRKLPVGRKRSEEAVKMAMESGFISIPDGYTFVSESNSHLNIDKKKLIRIGK